MYKLSDKIANLTSYEPIKGDFSVRLDANESYIPLDISIVAEIAKEIQKIDYNRYPDPTAERACKAFGEFYGIESSFITAGNGSDELISVIINGFFKKGEKVVITSPDFSMYKFYCHISEVEAVILNKSADFEMTAEQIIGLVKNSNAKGLVLSNPCNPTSRGICKADVLLIANSLPDVLVVIDEAYMDFDDMSILNTANGFDNVIVLRTCSKAFGLAAIRLGFAVANSKITKAIRAIKSPYNVNTLTNVAGSVVLSHKDYLKECTQKIIAQRKKLFTMLKQIEGITVIDSLTNFVFIKTKNSENIAKSLQEKGIAIRQMGDTLRITAGSDSELEMFIKAFNTIYNLKVEAL